MAPTDSSVTIKYSKPGTLPPIYLAGSFSDPPWQPREMEHSILEDGEREFHQEVQVEEGHMYQYKFRIGEGEWWILNEDHPTVTDDIGNRNNLLIIPRREEHRQEGQTDGKSLTHDAEQATRIPQMSSMEDISSKPDLTEGETVTKLAEAMPTATGSHHHHETTRITPAIEPLDSMKAIERSTDSPTDNKVAAMKEVASQELDIQLPDSTIPAINPELAVAPSLTPAAGLQNPVRNSNSDLKKEEQPPAKIEKEPPVPIVVIERTDLEPRHRNDFGPDATMAQENAYPSHASDAYPNQMDLREQSHTPDFALTASEVADIAATLDNEPLTPPMSDEEAGRTGYRRMSNTPIPEVAATAAEVADVAATLGDHTPPLIIEFPAKPSFSGELEIDSGKSTPAHEKVPRFSHECCELPERVEPYSHGPIESLQAEQESHDGQEPEELDLEDPSIEMFPTERDEILAKLREIQERLPEDETRVDGIPPSPVVEPNHSPLTNGQSHVLSPGLRAKNRSSSLLSINENQELDTTNELVMPLPVLPHAGSHDATGSHSNLEGDREKVSENQLPSIAHEFRARSPVDSSSVAPMRPMQEEEKSAYMLQQGSLMNDGSTDDTSDMKVPKEIHGVKIQEIHPESPQPTPSLRQSQPGPAKVDESAPPEVDTPSQFTPFVVGDRQLGHEASHNEIMDTGSGPNIEVIPATPGESDLKAEDDFVPKSVAQSTAVDENGQVEARRRKQPVSERSLTPSSMRSTNKEAKTQNFLKAFWRVVFVDWIGGLIMKFCGGARGRPKTLLVLSALAFFILAPRLLSSRSANELAS